MESIDKILADLKAENSQKPQPSQFKKSSSFVTRSSTNSGPIDNLLADIQKEYRQQEREQQEEKLISQRKRAQQWLNALNDQSEDCLWFEEFASSYPSKLEAAIDYLTALNQI